MSSILEVRAHFDPQTLPRLLNYVAQLGHAPRNFNAFVEDKVICASMELDGLSEQQINIVAEKMRSSVLVESVRVTAGRESSILPGRVNS
jgi:hypothetical protein